MKNSDSSTAAFASAAENDTVGNVSAAAAVVDHEDEEHEKWQNLSRCSRIKYIINHITVEPILAFFIVSSVIGNLTTQNLNLQKSCRVNLNLTDATCYALEKRITTNYTREEEASVQGLVTDMAMWQSIIQHTVPSVFVIFIGSWSDRTHKRKPILLLPIVGELIRVIGLLVCVYYFYELPMEVAGLVESVPSSLSGGWMLMFLATFTYIADVTTLKMRTIRIGVLNLSLTVGTSFGIALSGILYQKLGFYGIYLICTTLYSLGILYGLFCLKDQKTKPKTTPAICEDNKHATKQSFSNNVKEFFDLKHIINAFRITFKKGNDNRRIRIIMMMIVLMLIMGPMTGEMSVMYLSARIRFNWDELKYSLFSTFTMVTGFLGTTLALWLFSHKLQYDDALIAAIACSSKVIGSVIYAFAPNEFVFFLGSAVEFIHGASNIATRSIFTKLVNPDELGQVSAVIGVCEAFVPMIYAPMYSAFYKATMKTFPGAYFLLGGGMIIPAIFIFLWMHKGHKEREAQKKEKKKTETEEDNFDLNNDNVKIPKLYETSEKNGFENSTFEFDEIAIK